ncbi:MAG: ABC transporter permease, partial [Mesorhizobium sp.]
MPETGDTGTTVGEAALRAPRKQEAVPGLALGLALLSAGPVVILALLIVVLSFLSPYFLTGRNLSNILAQTAVISVVAMGQH